MTLDEIRNLEANWDSYGAASIDPLVIRVAAALAKTLPDWQIVPCSDGSVQLEIHQDGVDCELVISRAKT